MDGLLREVDIELACSSVLCAGSVLLLVLQIAERARSSRSHGQIKLPTTNEQAEELDTLLDEDVPEDVDSWRRHILYLKLACTAVAALNVVAWSVALYATGDTITKLQLYFWCNVTAVCIVWTFQLVVASHWRTTVLVAVLMMVASCERASINVFLPSNRAHQYSFDAITLYTSCAPALLLCIDLVIPRSPSLSTHSPFTYSISAEHKQTSLEESASLLSLITFSWTVPTMMSVIQQVQMQIYEIVMPYLHARNRSYNLYHAWKLSCASSLRGDLPANPKEEALGRCPKRVNAVLWRIVQANRSAFIVVWTFDIFLASARNLPALTVKHFLIELDAIEVRGTSKYAWAWLIIMVGSIAFRTLLTAADYFRWNARLQSRTRSAIATLVFERALLTRHGSSTEDMQNSVSDARSNLFNLYTTDADRAALAITRFSEAFVFVPIECGLAMWLLTDTLGTAAIFGLLIPFVFMLLSQLVVQRMVKTQKELMQATDTRLALSNEFLGAMKHIKLMAQEGAYAGKLLQARQREMVVLRKNHMTKIWLDILTATGAGFTLVASLFWYTKVEGRELSASTAFSSVLLTEVLRRSTQNLDTSIEGWTRCLNAARRLESFFAQEFKPSGQTGGNLPFPLRIQPMENLNKAAPPILAEGAVFKWSLANPESEDQTQSVDFGVGSLTVAFEAGLHVVCGPTASGKTLMLLGLLGEVPLAAGHLTRPTSPADTLCWYSDDLTIDPENWLAPVCAYAPWLQSGSIRDNILFGLPLNEDRLGEVVHACCLLPDLERWTDGLYTQIGEKGVILSGGQKARVALARAMYSRARYIFLDDTLSAVDVHTAQHILQHCLIGPLAASRTVILASHNVSLCAPHAQTVVHLERGNPLFIGSGTAYLTTELYVNAQNEKGDQEEATLASTNGSTTPTSSATQAPSNSKALPVQVGAPQKVTLLLKAEQKGNGSVGLDLWLFWAKGNGGILFWTAGLMILVAHKGIWNIRDAIVSVWVDALQTSRRSQSETNDHYLIILSVVLIVTVPIMALRTPILFYGSRRFGRQSYSHMVEVVFRAPMRYFDITSIGTLLNRFSGDIAALDTEIPDTFRALGGAVSGLVVTMMSILIVTPWFGLPLAAVTMLYRYFGLLYMAAAREMRRSEVIARSPMYANMSEMLAGRPVIRAFGATTRILLQQFHRCDRWQAFDQHMWSFNRWLAVRFELSSVLLVACVGCASLLLGVQRISVGLTGFLLTGTIRAYQEAMYVMRFWSRAELAMVSVERIRDFCQIESEGPGHTSIALPPNWPAFGKLSAEKLSVRYARDLPKVLRELSFDIEPGTRVAVVGATGSGKSTLSLALMRVLEACEGTIYLDDVDISQVGLYDLRSRITIVPQDPTVLSGTLRQALDPLGEGFTDQMLFGALRAVHLLHNSTTQPEDRLKSPFFENLESRVSEHGKNLSAGERQLLCLARAILKRHKFVILDEATSSVDFETDKLITETLASEFRGVTLLTIAHRLRTVIGYDKVFVMAAGQFVESGRPAELLKDPSSHFYALYQAAGAEEFEALQGLSCSE